MKCYFTLAELSERWGVTVVGLGNCCRDGRFAGAFQPTTKGPWRVPVSTVLAIENGDYTPRDGAKMATEELMLELSQ